MLTHEATKIDPSQNPSLSPKSNQSRNVNHRCKCKHNPDKSICALHVSISIA